MSPPDKRASVDASGNSLPRTFYSGSVFHQQAKDTQHICVFTNTRQQHTTTLTRNRQKNELPRCWQRLLSSGDGEGAYRSFVSSSALFPLGHYVTGWRRRSVYILPSTSSSPFSSMDACFHNPHFHSQAVVCLVFAFQCSRRTLWKASCPCMYIDEHSAHYVDTQVASTLYTLTAAKLTGPQLPPTARKRYAPGNRLKLKTSPAKPSQEERFLQTAKRRGPAGQEVFLAIRKEVFIDSGSINKVYVSYRRLKASTFQVWLSLNWMSVQHQTDLNKKTSRVQSLEKKL